MVHIVTIRHQIVSLQILEILPIFHQLQVRFLIFVSIAKRFHLGTTDGLTNQDAGCPETCCSTENCLRTLNLNGDAIGINKEVPLIVKNLK